MNPILEQFIVFGWWKPFLILALYIILALAYDLYGGGGRNP
jgi:hypothetical protein